MTGAYDDIIHLPHHVSTKHPRMKAIDRAAQFSPFAALVGHGAAIRETARLTDERIELDESVKNELSRRLQFIADQVKAPPEVEIVYFQPDDRKEGGAYMTAVNAVKRIDEYTRMVVMNDGVTIPIDEIVSIEGPVFDPLKPDLCDD